MAISIFDLFSIGIGPSSSHSIGPMRAANRFVEQLRGEQKLSQCVSIVVRLYGSLAWTGKGHGTDKAIMLGLEGALPERIDPDTIDERIASIRAAGQLQLPGGPTIFFDEDTQLLFLQNDSLPHHPNGMRFTARDTARDTEGQDLLERIYYSIGGGFVIDESAAGSDSLSAEGLDETCLPFPYHSGTDLLRMAEDSGLSVSQMTWANECCWRSEAEIRAGLLERWQVMQQSVERGCRNRGVLPGCLQLGRRAPDLYAQLTQRDESQLRDPLAVLDWVDLFALAVSEENAAAGRVVTAPTNGAAGILPSVLHYYHRFVPDANDEGIVQMLLTAGAIGILYKQNASLSGAEVGCQGEVGVACSMAAGALTEAIGGTVRQVEMAAEIGMEHNLGLTCDPVGGLVQVPCIERCAMAAVKAINASRMAMRSDGRHRISLDRVIVTMRETGRDMLSKYKETSLGGLAVAVTEC